MILITIMSHTLVGLRLNYFGGSYSKLTGRLAINSVKSYYSSYKIEELALSLLKMNKSSLIHKC